MIAKNLLPEDGEKQIIDELLEELRSEQKNISSKFTYESINLIAKKADLSIQRIMNDDKKWFSLVQVTK